MHPEVSPDVHDEALFPDGRAQLPQHLLLELATGEESGRHDNLWCQSCMRETQLTFSAPASIHSLALPGVMPPPTCKPSFHAASASRADSSLPGPSLMTCPPVKPLVLYSSA